MEIKVNRNLSDLKKIMRIKAEKKKLQCRFEGDSIKVDAIPGKDTNSQTPIPVMFKGKITEMDEECVIKGRMTYGFCLEPLMLVATLLIVARLAWSVYKKQSDNIILCVIVAVVLVIVVIVAKVKGKELQIVIQEFLNNLDKK